jgi:hypothetical protein
MEQYFLAPGNLELYTHSWQMGNFEKSRVLLFAGKRVDFKDLVTKSLYGVQELTLFIEWDGLLRFVLVRDIDPVLSTHCEYWKKSLESKDPADEEKILELIRRDLRPYLRARLRCVA